MTDPVGDANATFAATVVDQWIHCGVRSAFVAPGSRSTPLAVALVARSELRVEVLLDERSAGFAALGSALSSGRPAIVLCTSGTASTHFHAAVAEAGLSCVPKLVCTANRPPELWNVGAPQTIDQHDLYGRSGRGFIEVEPPDQTDPAGWRGIANQAWAAAMDRRQPGPVQVDLSFREPLLGEVGDIGSPLPRPDLEKPTVATDAEVAAVVDRIIEDDRPRRGVIVAGRGESDPATLGRLSDLLGWPIIADHRSGLRDGTALRFHDPMLRRPSELEESTTRILRFGEPLSSKALSQWIARRGSDPDAVTGFQPWSRTINPELVVKQRLPEAGAAGRLVAEIERRGIPSLTAWADAWRTRDDEQATRIGTIVSDPATEPGIANASLAAVPAGGALVVASSMPVRDVEWYGEDRADIDVFSNRGANGIDGVIATAVGVASTGRPTVCLVGDVAFLHDQSTLTALGRRALDLTIVVVDNDGGGIFGMLPQRTELDETTYETLFGTPHGTDISGLCRAHGVEVIVDPTAPNALRPDGTRVAVFSTERQVTLELRSRISG